ncbi:hypothetical protein [Armatimonas rosea]|uniref:Uncharacterized protein n=1 Tax=Armatimonas rosea TaxID=685828 RepID=A0A7W9W8B5_ARMRO|nr:hypothetical protein [Armatimonas rosea]MBB6053359.1 hypothetical protein [Armatimonas rosea]
MTEPEQTQSLQAAFPTEPVRPELSQRIENLTPLTPTVTGYKLKFRHIFAVFAVLWIGHNVPTALKIAKQNLAPVGYHTRLYLYNLSSTNRQKAERVLRLESWHRGGKIRTNTLDMEGRLETIDIYADHTNFSYNKSLNTVTITHMPEIKVSPYERYKTIAINTIPILLFRTRDNRPTEFKYGKQLRVARIGSKNYYYDPETELVIQIKELDKGKSQMEVETSVHIPDSVFWVDFPKDAKRTETTWTNSNGRPSTYQPDYWKLLTEQVKQYTVGQHP